MRERLILWDFDGTLAFRAGMWRGAMIEVLDRHAPGHGVRAEALRPYMRDAFPWHRAEVAHPELAEPEAWWAPIHRVMAAAYEGVGLSAHDARVLARAARARYLDHRHGWALFDDTVEVLGALTAEGWRHAILSNHVPELPALASALGLGDHFEAIHTSAAIGYEKPHPAAFAAALDAAGHPDTVWMVGDNPTADVGGAQALGIPSVLVRRDGTDLHAAAEIIRGGPRAPAQPWP